MFVPAFFGLLLAALVSGQITITPHHATVKVGEEVTVMCKVPYAIDSCRMHVGDKSYRLRPEERDGDIVYKGEGGLKAGECGATLRNVRESWNGNITCTVPAEKGPLEPQASMRLIVAKAPELPRLVDSGKSNFLENEKIEVQCVVPSGRPAAKVGWFLKGPDDTVPEDILEGFHVPLITNEPEGSDLETTRANLTRVLSAEDGGKILICRAEHKAWDQPKEASKQLIVQYPPRRADSADSQITIFGLKLGSEGRLNVTVRASPPPRAHWTVNGQQLDAPQHTDDARALEPVVLGNGYYNVTLVLPLVSKADVERTYYLRVSNDLGDADFTLRISTMDEPAGVELDTGAVVGIVIAALVLVIAVSLLVFAKATDRWCFAGGRDRDPTKSSGESSDTESAAGGLRRESRAGRARAAALGAWGRVRASMPRGRDKVQASEREPVDDEKAAEKKEGVVYAELALAETGRETERAAPPSTEYAEIVYTEQGQKEAKE